MTDAIFIATILQKGQAAKEKARLEFSGISVHQLNWKATPESWSIAQCLDHLVISDSAYFPDLEKITNGNYKMSFWEKYSPFSRMWGRMFKNSLTEQVKKKMKAPGKLRPPASEMTIELIEKYHTNLATLLEYISNCRNVDVDKTIVNSPIIPIITYSLRDNLTFLMQHEHRHLDQAARVKSNEGFPKSI